MKLVRAIVWMLVAILASLLISCIDGREEYWLEADGRARAEITYELPASAAAVHGGEAGIRQALAEFFQKAPEIHPTLCEVTTVGPRVRVRVLADVASVQDLPALRGRFSSGTQPSAVSHLVGVMATVRRGRTLDFSRTITPAKAIPGAAWLPTSRVAGHRLTYVAHLPTPVRASNATRVEDAGRTLVWDFPLEQTLRQPVVTSFQTDLPIPWGLVTTVAVPLSLAGVWVTARLTRAKRRGGQRG